VYTKVSVILISICGGGLQPGSPPHPFGWVSVNVIQNQQLHVSAFIQVVVTLHSSHKMV